MLMAIMPRDMTCEKSLSFGLLHRAVASGEEDVFAFFFEIANREHGADGFARLQRNQVADVLALAGGAHVGNLIDLQPVDAARIGEDQNVGVGRGDEEMLDEIFVARLHARASGAATTLHAIRGDRRALQVSGMADGDRHLLVGDQVFEHDFGGFVFDRRCDARRRTASSLSSSSLMITLRSFLLGTQDRFVLGDASRVDLQFVRDFVDRELG